MRGRCGERFRGLFRALAGWRAIGFVSVAVGFLAGHNGGMKPSFNFLDLLPFQLLGGAGIVCALFGWEMGGFWLLPSLALAAILLTAALRSVPMR